MTFSSNESDHIRRKPYDAQGKIRGGAGDLVGDEEREADVWDELIAEEEGRTESRMDEVGNAETAILAGTGDLDHAHQPLHDESVEQEEEGHEAEGR